MNKYKLDASLVTIDNKGEVTSLALKDVADPTLKQELTQFLISDRIKVRNIKKVIKLEVINEDDSGKID